MIAKLSRQKGFPLSILARMRASFVLELELESEGELAGVDMVVAEAHWGEKWVLSAMELTDGGQHRLTSNLSVSLEWAAKWAQWEL